MRFFHKIADLGIHILVLAESVKSRPLLSACHISYILDFSDEAHLCPFRLKIIAGNNSGLGFVVVFNLSIK